MVMFSIRPALKILPFLRFSTVFRQQRRLVLSKQRLIHTAGGGKNQNVAMVPERAGSQPDGSGIESDDEFDDEVFMKMIAERQNNISTTAYTHGEDQSVSSDSLGSQEMAELCKVSERWATEQIQLRGRGPGTQDISSSPPVEAGLENVPFLGNDDPRLDEGLKKSSGTDSSSGVKRSRDCVDDFPNEALDFVPLKSGPNEFVRPSSGGTKRQSPMKSADTHNKRFEFASTAGRKSSDVYSWPSSPSYQRKPTRNINFLDAPNNETNIDDYETSSTASDEPLEFPRKENQLIEEEDSFDFDQFPAADEEPTISQSAANPPPHKDCREATENNPVAAKEESVTPLAQEEANPVTDIPVPFLSLEQREVLRKVLDGRSIFFTGSAGTGKSVLLREIIKCLKNRHTKPNYFKNIPGNRTDDASAVAVTASTGLAACNIGGITLHSFAGIGLGKEDAEKLVKKVKRNRKNMRKWRTVKVLIVDEVSMIDGELFDKLEYVARKVRRKETPFGGIQLVLTGDFFQLPPVPEKDRVAKFAFEAETWSTVVLETYQLCKVFRQKDNTFSTILNEMRLGCITPETVRTFQERSRPLTGTGEIEATELFPRKADVERANNRRLAALEGNKVVYEAVDNYKDEYLKERKLLDNMIAPKVLTIKEGAQVMSIKNIDETLVNGSVGTVVGFMDENTYHRLIGVDEDDEDSQSYLEDETIFGKKPKTFRSLEDSLMRKISAVDELQSAATHKGRNYPVVRFQYPDGTFREVLLSPEKWTIEDYDGKVLASREQVPLILAWALSIHKAQGQTLQYVKVDLNHAFEKGQAYVALSRATSLDGLQVLGFSESKVMVHPKVIDFYNTLKKHE
ncbi:hypothetical protein TRICI_006227 [Trichomonascus ciferrii]|uniref:ATP-dependent DNA helicase PIF1 n=1 Tax=Trichomonascus ciferrii TaxID=44093 RepID=A0A642UJS9_9ASCO|nr:hypothetical protein TRICI_006227 [Trichomonascus ciferrii]